MTDEELTAVLERVVRGLGAAGPGTPVRASVVEPRIVRAVVDIRGGTSFLLAADGGLLQYMVPIVSDDDALALFREGRRSIVPDGVLEAAGFHP